MNKNIHSGLEQTKTDSHSKKTEDGRAGSPLPDLFNTVLFSHRYLVNLEQS